MGDSTSTRPETEEDETYIQTGADMRYARLLKIVEQQTSYELAYELDHAVGDRLVEAEDRAEYRLAHRIDELERHMAGIAAVAEGIVHQRGTSPTDVIDEIRARRIVIVDATGRERIVAEAHDDFGDLTIHGFDHKGQNVAISLHASEQDDAPHVGLTMMANGDAAASLDTVARHGDVSTYLHLEGRDGDHRKARTGVTAQALGGSAELTVTSTPDDSQAEDRTKVVLHAQHAELVEPSAEVRRFVAGEEIA